MSTCAACGLPGHRYGRNEGKDRFDPMACINSLRAQFDDPVAAVRRGVESGTIEGTVMPTNSIEDEEFGELLPVLHVEDHGLYLVIPVSDGGEDRP